jgi:hypothetical protein
MNEQNESALTETSLRGRFYLEHYAFIALIILAFIGEAVTNISPYLGFWYWFLMIPIFAIEAIMYERRQAQREGYAVANLILIQIIHWGGAFVALITLYVLWHTGRLQHQDVGIVALLIFSIITFLDGLHCGWRFYLAGIFLFLTTILAANLKYFIWVALLIAIPIVVFGIYWERYHHFFPTTARNPERQRSPAALLNPASVEKEDKG